MPSGARQSLGKRNNSTLVSSPPSSSGPASSNKRLKACVPSPSTVVLNDGPNANKENIPPLQEQQDNEAFVTANVRVTRSRRDNASRRRASSSLSLDTREELLGGITTPPDTPVRDDMLDEMHPAMSLPAPQFPVKTPARELNALPLATPPDTPRVPLHVRARALLRSTTDSFDVVGRQTERIFVSDFLRPFVSGGPDFDNAPTSLYISGSPGTGKTALVTSTLATMKTSDVLTAYINCMGLKDVDVLWSRVLAALGEPSVSTKAKTSLRQFEHKLAEEDFKCILVLDELDAFAPSTLSLIFGLPGRFPASLRVLAISNDLTQSLASPTLSIHRPSLTLAFSAYTAVEMQEIIRARLTLLSSDKFPDNSMQPRADDLAKIIQPAALTLLVKKVSSQTGDIRQALEVLRRAIELAAPAVTALESDDAPPSPVGMSHVIDAVKRTKAAGIVTANKSMPSVNVGGRGPLDGCVSALGLQARLVLVTILIARRRAARDLPLHSLSPPTTPASTSPVKSSPSKPKMRRCASLGSSGAELSPSKVYALYSNILRTSPSAPFEPVSRSEYTDLLGVLEAASLVVVPNVSSLSPTKPKRARNSASFNAGMSAASLLSREEGGSVMLCAAEDEILRALLATAGALDAEVAQIWERETKRIEKALFQRSEVSRESSLDREDYL